MLEIILILSNGCIYPAIQYVVKNYRQYYTEIFTFISLFTLSVGYHTCLLFGCEVYDFFWRFDQIFALQSVTCSFMNLVDNLYIKNLVWLLNFGANIATLYTDPNSLFTVLLTSVSFNLMLICHFYKISSLNKFIEFLKRNDILLNNLVITLVLVTIGLVFFKLANIYTSYYYIYHSIWHIFIFLAIFSSLFIKKRKLTIQIPREISLDNFANYPKTPDGIQSP